jgi:hypothetical protein
MKIIDKPIVRNIINVDKFKKVNCRFIKYRGIKYYYVSDLNNVFDKSQVACMAARYVKMNIVHNNSVKNYVMLDARSTKWICESSKAN